MTRWKLCFVVWLATTSASSAFALPADGPSAGPALNMTRVGYWYGYGYRPYPYGFYPRRRFYRGLSYGTGYHGRGTWSGGPVGGLPNRN